MPIFRYFCGENEKTAARMARRGVVVAFAAHDREESPGNKERHTS